MAEESYGDVIKNIMQTRFNAVAAASAPRRRPRLRLPGPVCALCCDRIQGAPLPPPGAFRVHTACTNPPDDLP